jgi:hypothetical protein
MKKLLWIEKIRRLPMKVHQKQPCGLPMKVCLFGLPGNILQIGMN